MLDIREVLRHKESQSEQLQKEIDALRIAIRILEAEPVAKENSARGFAEVTPKTNGNGLRTNEASPKQFP